VSSGDIAKRADAFGMPGKIVDGHDFFAIYEASKEAIERARAGEGPSLMEFKLNRYFGHFEGDAQTYRGKDEVKKIRDEKDCLKLFRARVTEAGLLDDRQLKEIDDDAAKLIENAVTRAKAAPYPPAADLHTDVYVSY
jgi:TPP-dependent pyruvate/acetoin dehydrogenase alpha subunit